MYMIFKMDKVNMIFKIYLTEIILRKLKHVVDTKLIRLKKLFI